MSQEISELLLLLQAQKDELAARERDLHEKTEELESQKEELTAAIEEVLKKNAYLNQALEELRERNHELDQLVYRASHDLKTPVTAIAGLVNLFRREFLSENGFEYLRHIDASVQQMMRLLTSLSWLTQASMNELHLSAFTYAELVGGALSDLRGLPDFGRIRLTEDYPTDATLYSDRLLWHNLLYIILHNAYRYRHAEDPAIVIRFTLEPQQVVLEVEDNGEGMTPEVAARAFDLFYRGSEKSEGAGLGLYVARKITTRLNGTIAVLASLQPGVVVRVIAPVIPR